MPTLVDFRRCWRSFPLGALRLGDDERAAAEIGGLIQILFDFCFQGNLQIRVANSQYSADRGWRRPTKLESHGAEPPGVTAPQLPLVYREIARCPWPAPTCQQVAQSWLVYRLTGCEWMLGVSVFCAYIPMLVLTPLTGLVADRYRRRPIVMVAQTAAMGQALLLAVLTLGGGCRSGTCWCWRCVWGWPARLTCRGGRRYWCIWWAKRTC